MSCAPSANTPMLGCCGDQPATEIARFASAVARMRGFLEDCAFEFPPIVPHVNEAGHVYSPCKFYTTQTVAIADFGYSVVSNYPICKTVATTTQTGSLSPDLLIGEEELPEDAAVRTCAFRQMTVYTAVAPDFVPVPHKKTYTLSGLVDLGPIRAALKAWVDGYDLSSLNFPGPLGTEKRGWARYDYCSGQVVVTGIIGGAPDGGGNTIDDELGSLGVVMSAWRSQKSYTNPWTSGRVQRTDYLLKTTNWDCHYPTAAIVIYDGPFAVPATVSLDCPAAGGLHSISNVIV